MQSVVQKTNRKKRPVFKQMFVAEKVIEKKRIDGEVLYLVKWENYSHHENTWEPYQHIKNTQAYLDFINRVNQSIVFQQSNSKSIPHLNNDIVSKKLKTNDVIVISSESELQNDSCSQDYDKSDLVDDDQSQNQNNQMSVQSNEVQGYDQQIQGYCQQLQEYNNQIEGQVYKIQEFHDQINQKTKMVEEHNDEIIQECNEYGSLETDKIKEIVGSRIFDSCFFVRVRWEKRKKTMIRPADSWYNYMDIANTEYRDKLIRFFNKNVEITP